MGGIDLKRYKVNILILIAGKFPILGSDMKALDGLSNLMAFKAKFESLSHSNLQYYYPPPFQGHRTQKHPQDF